MTTVAPGLALALAALLVAAGLPKLVRPRHVARSLRRAFGSRPHLELLGRLLGAWELVLAAALLTVPWVAVAAAGAVTFLGFAAFVVLAVRRGTSCGCWASLSEGPAGGAELARTGTLALAALGLLALRLTGARTTILGHAALGFSALGWAAATLGLTWLAAVLGGRFGPRPPENVTQRLALQAPPTRLGRGLSRAAFLAGWVQAGTARDSRRYVVALSALRLSEIRRERSERERLRPALHLASARRPQRPDRRPSWQRLVGGEQPPEHLVRPEAGVGEDRDGAGQALHDLTVVGQERGRHGQDPGAADREQVTVPEGLTHPGDRLVQPLGHIGQRQHLDLGIEHVIGRGDRTHGVHDAT